MKYLIILLMCKVLPTWANTNLVQSYSVHKAIYLDTTLISLDFRKINDNECIRSTLCNAKYQENESGHKVKSYDLRANLYNRSTDKARVITLETIMTKYQNVENTDESNSINERDALINCVEDGNKYVDLRGC